MRTLREKLGRRLSDLTDSALSKSEQGELLDAVIKTLTSEARSGNLPRELLAAIDDGRDVAAARRLAGLDAK